MRDLNRETMNRRAFLKDGLRSVLCGGLVVLGVVFGWRKYSKQGQGSSCLASSPCSSCSKLSDCDEPRAIDLKRKQTLSGPRSLPMKKRVKYGE